MSTRNSNPAKVTISNMAAVCGMEDYESGGDCPQVRLWNVYTQQWEIRAIHMVPSEVFATLPESERVRIERVRRRYLRLK